MDIPFVPTSAKTAAPSFEEFTDKFHDDYACAEYLFKARWPNGFVCPKCGSQKGKRLEARPWVFQCTESKVRKVDGVNKRIGCHKQTSLISGTIMHGTHLPLRTWFLAAYLLGTHSNGMSALQIMPKLGIRSYKTAWLLLHKIRRAMVQPNRSPLSGTIEIDETFIPYRENDEPRDGGQGHSQIGKIMIAGAVEIVDTFYPGRIRLERISNVDKANLHSFILRNTSPDSTIITDGNRSYRGVVNRTHVSKNMSANNALPAHISMKWIHRVFSNFKRWGMGTFHGLARKHIDAYANEFVFRWNRRRQYHTNVETMLAIGREIGPVKYRDIVGDTTEWRNQNWRRIENLIIMMADEDLRKEAKAIAKRARRPLVDVIQDLKKKLPKRKYKKHKTTWSQTLPQRRRNDPLFRPSTGRTKARDRALIETGIYKHIPLNSPIMLA